MALNVLHMCRDTNLKVLKILTEISKKEDLTDFITTIQMVQITINGLLKSKKNFQFDTLKTLQNSLNEYEGLLINLNSESSLLRIVRSARLRKKIETANSDVHKKLETLKKTIVETQQSIEQQNQQKPSGGTIKIKEPDEVKDLSRLSMSLKNSPMMQSFKEIDEQELLAAPVDETVEQEAESNMRLAMMIEDQDVKDTWAALFGLDQFAISWDQFIAGVRKTLSEVTPEDEKVLRYVLDISGTEWINQHKFSEFLKGFGPFQDCIKNMKSIMGSKWFMGFLTGRETELLLRNQPPGTFVIRFSATAPGSFALAFVQDTNNSIVKILINSQKPLGFQIEEQGENVNAKTFEHLHELVEFYNVYLHQPLVSDIPFESWFEGDINTQETQELLEGHPPGCFVIRFSSQVGHYTISFVSPGGDINHTRVEHEDVANGNYRINNEGQYYYFNSLKEIVDFYGDALKYPLMSLTDEFQVEANRIIMQWKREREQQMAEISNVVANLFNVEAPLELHRFEGQTTNESIQEIQNKVGNIVHWLFPVV